jgi:NADH dehydrogenase FAD-containing subunit
LFEQTIDTPETINEYASLQEDLKLQIQTSASALTVYVVGAGPVGMMAAARYLDLIQQTPQGEARQPQKFKFKFIEKRDSYSRLQQV